MDSQYITILTFVNNFLVLISLIFTISTNIVIGLIVTLLHFGYIAKALLRQIIKS